MCAILLQKFGILCRDIVAFCINQENIAVIFGVLFVFFAHSARNAIEAIENLHIGVHSAKARFVQIHCRVGQCNAVKLAIEWGGFVANVIHNVFDVARLRQLWKLVKHTCDGVWLTDILYLWPAAHKHIGNGIGCGMVYWCLATKNWVVGLGSQKLVRSHGQIHRRKHNTSATHSLEKIHIPLGKLAQLRPLFCVKVALANHRNKSCWHHLL